MKIKKLEQRILALEREIGMLRTVIRVNGYLTGNTTQEVDEVLLRCCEESKKEFFLSEE